MLEIGQQEIDAVARVIKSGHLFRYGDPKTGHFNECNKFEKELAAMVGCEYALSVTSGTAALICALVGLGVGPGDEVILPGYTFMASALAPLAIGAIPVIAEIDESLTLDPKDAEAKITPRTKVIMPVHMCGLPANLDAIMRVARRHKVKIVEDACQADGGSYKGKRLGSIGDVGAFFRPHAKDIGVPFFAGWNFRLNEILGAVLRVQLKRIDGLLKRTRAAKHRIVEGLSGSPGLTFITHNDLEGDCGTTVGFLFDSQSRMRRFLQALGKQNVGAWSPIDSGRHVYTNWEPVMEKRGSYHPAIDAYRRTENRDANHNYRADMCPRTLDILSRTAFINTSPQQKAADIRGVITACKKAADAVR
jgi:dTDP-4-amino-4,6-dideoxygalactose transaminase